MDRACPVCNDTVAAVLFAEENVDLGKLDRAAFASRKVPEYMHWRLWQCRRCDVVFASPVPPTTEIALAYEGASFESAHEAAYAGRTYARVLRRLIARLPDRHGALDIGAGDGAFLHQLLDCGFDGVAGIEPSSAPIQKAATRVRPLIRQGFFEPGSLAEGQFSLVCCLQTMEHVPDPLACAREAHRILKPGGAFLVIGHNRRSFSARVLGRKSPIYDVEHLQLFSFASIDRLLRVAGFQLRETHSLLNTYPLRYWFQLCPMPLAIKKALLSFLRISRMGAIPLSLPAGNLVAIGFK